MIQAAATTPMIAHVERSAIPATTATATMNPASMRNRGPRITCGSYDCSSSCDSSSAAAGCSASAFSAGADETGGAETAAEIKATYCGTTAFGANGTGIFTAAQFCTLYLATCTGADAASGYTTMPSCENMYGMVTTTGHCRSYHLCNALGTDTAANRMTHCPHAIGMGGQCAATN